MRVDTDDFGRPCRCGREHHIEVKEIIIEEGAVKKLEEAMSDGFLKEYISPLLICDTNTLKATEECLEDIYDRCQVLTLDAEGLHADEHAVEIVENYMEEDIDLILAVGSGTIHDISRYLAYQSYCGQRGRIRIKCCGNDLERSEKNSTGSGSFSCVC